MTLTSCMVILHWRIQGQTVRSWYSPPRTPLIIMSFAHRLLNCNVSLSFLRSQTRTAGFQGALDDFR
ncbi:hypothetical protein M413DRAFT_260525 [Hebeloma cylindrosporum]|uniref:Uncharacterized protein n=1 Tax=Hebeloma cylindrosporum TaxID=76867 RepID=A0A0C3CS18_HEBCY|nr:hypothetical protein M413DRAFT_260525 [Hebeloma cylindrosporum h7]